jgi:hypothetical protein
MMRKGREGGSKTTVALRISLEPPIECNELKIMLEFSSIS